MEPAVAVAAAAVVPVAAAAVVAATVKNVSSAIDLDTYVSLLEASIVTEKIDLGAAVVIKALHLLHGTIILVNTAGAESAVMYM